MPSFEDLGLRPELLRTLVEEEMEQPTALQAAVIPALRRGGNLVARTSSGSGKTLGYALGVLDRLTPREPTEEEAPLRFVVLTPTQESAERVALSVFPYAQTVGLTLTVPGGTWGTALDQVEVLIAPVADVMRAVRGSVVKLDNLEAVVVDGASAIQQLGDWEQVDTLLDLTPRDAQRILVSAAFPEEVEDLIDRRVKRALRYPPEPALAEERPTPTGQIGYVLVAGPQKLEVLARQLSQKEGESLPPVIYCRTDERAADLAEQLSIRGFLVGAADDPEVDVAVAAADTTRAELLEGVEGELGQTISYDVPADGDTLSTRHGGDPDAVVMVEPRELPHLKEIAQLALLRVRALPLPLEQGAAAAQLERFRDEIRRAIREEDLTAQMLLLEPLLEEFSAAEVAAAVAALLRRRTPTQAVGAAPAPAAAGGAAAVSPAVEAGPAPAAWTRLYVGVGARDEVRKGDLVGAIAGEADIKGAQIGRIEIRDNFSIVEVESDVAERVIRAVNGTTIKGRSVRVDFDRAADRARKGDPGARPERRQANRPDAKRRVVRRPPRE